VAKAEVLAHELARTSKTEIRVVRWENFPQVCVEVDLIVNASCAGLDGEPIHKALNSI
jgi:shikimate 5-dehydrogenase